MLKILIVENNAFQFEVMSTAIKNEFASAVDIYPKNVLDKEKNFFDLNYLIDALEKREFREVVEFYKERNLNFDLFIIDVSLTPMSDKLGLDFLKFINKNIKHEFKVIVISNTDEIYQLVKEPFISKMKHGTENNFTTELIYTLKATCGITQVRKNNSTSIPQLLTQYVKEHGWKYAIHKTWLFIMENIQRHIIDKLVLFLFYILMIVTIFYSGYNILISVREAVHNNLEETMMLKVAEHVFLDLLPMFIVFGFFHYYKTNIRVFLLEGNTYSVDEAVSTKTMNLTKILFVSSIISYTSIKIIEELFINKTAAPIRLISFFILLITLMIYFIFLNNKSHEAVKKDL